jgi:hypothetical protein
MEQYPTVATGLNGPQGVLVGPDGNVWVIDSGVGGDQEIRQHEPTQVDRQISVPVCTWVPKTVTCTVPACDCNSGCGWR